MASTETSLTGEGKKPNEDEDQAAEAYAERLDRYDRYDRVLAAADTPDRIRVATVRLRDQVDAEISAAMHGTM